MVMAVSSSGHSVVKRDTDTGVLWVAASGTSQLRRVQQSLLRIVSVYNFQDIRVTRATILYIDFDV